MSERVEKLALYAGFNKDKYGLYWDDDSNKEGVDLQTFADVLVDDVLQYLKEEIARLTSHRDADHDEVYREYFNHAIERYQDVIDNLKARYGVEE